MILIVNQLINLKEQYNNKAKSIKDRIDHTLASTVSVENAVSSLTFAATEMQKCENHQKMELRNSLLFLDSLYREKYSINDEIQDILTQVSLLQQRRNNSCHYSKLRLICCRKCIGSIKKTYKKQLIATLAGDKSLLASINNYKSSTKSLENFRAEACNCSII